MHPMINLTHLKFFCDAVVYQSISEAAKMNYITQSAVSQAITKLETIFGVQLFFHNRQKLQLTDEGQIVFEQARAIFRAVQDTFQKVNQTKDQITGCVKFVTSKSLGMSFIASAYKSIKENFPLLDFKFRMGGKNLIRTALRQEDAEFAIVVYGDNFDQFEKITLHKGLFRLYQSKDLPSDAIKEGVLVYEDCFYAPELKTFLEDSGYQNPIQDMIPGWELTARFTELNIGVGFFPDYILSHNRYPNIVPHPLEIPSFEYEICAIHNKGVKLSRTAQLFLEQLTTG